MNKIILVKKKTYRNGDDAWSHGDPCYISGRDWRGEAAHKWVGSCPNCNSRCWDYGCGWACVNDYCPNNPENFACSTGPAPSWWETNISVNKEGSSFIAYYENDFINIQESECTFGDSPRKAVEALVGVAV